jgi:hypothetical protein
LVLRFEDVVDADGNSVLNLADLNAAITSVIDHGVQEDVTIHFDNGASISLAEYGDGTKNSIDDLGVPIIITA